MQPHWPRFPSDLLCEARESNERFGFISFFGLVYILPSLLTLGAAFPLGLLVSHKIPTFKKPACQLITCSLTIIYFTIAVSALLSNQLNYGVNLIIVGGMPVFSVICSVGTFLVVTVYLAITKPVTS